MKKLTDLKDFYRENSVLVDGEELTKLFSENIEQAPAMLNGGLKSLEERYNTDRANLLKAYILAKAKYRPGQIVRSVSGFLKIKKISLSLMSNIVKAENIEILYIGYKYKKVNGMFIRTKNPVYNSVFESSITKAYD